MKNKIITLAISFLASSGMAMADLHEVENFTAYISAKDLKNSSGQALTSGGSALRQDRANYFKFNKKDSMDDAGTAKFFKSASNRALIPSMIKNSLAKGMITQSDLNQLLQGGKVASVIVSKSSAGKLYCTIAISEPS